jgi:hypothetical protein
VWGIGAATSYRWRSKRFSFPHNIGFSAAQVEAEAYPLTIDFYVLNTLFFTKVVENRVPFRLPPSGGRDWEFELTGDVEVFNVVVAQSMEEMASA